MELPEGCREYCLNCWLNPDQHTRTDEAYVLREVEGDLLKDYADALKLGYHLAVMPVARLHLDGEPVAFPRMVCFFPQGTVKLDSLGIAPNDGNSRKLAEKASYLSGIGQPVLDNNALVVFPCWFDWAAFRQAEHKAHLELIRSLSEIVDGTCFNLVRFLQCPIEPVHALPARAGQVDSNPMMSGAVVVQRRESRGAHRRRGRLYAHSHSRPRLATPRRREHQLPKGWASRAGGEPCAGTVFGVDRVEQPHGQVCSMPQPA